MRYREVAPSKELSNLVACHWEFAADESLSPGHLHTIPVDGCVSIAISRSGDGHHKCVYVGPRLDPLRIPVFPGDRFWGVRILPGASKSAIGVAGRELFGKWGLLAFVRPELSNTLLQSLQTASSLEEAIPVFESLLIHREPPPAIASSVTAITACAGSIPVGSLPSVAGLSERQFQRVFLREVGLTAKQYARICRLRAAAIGLVSGKQITWTQIAVDRGYADQSHLIREFQVLFGISPGEFERQFLADVEHGSIEWGCNL